MAYGVRLAMDTHCGSAPFVESIARHRRNQDIMQFSPSNLGVPSALRPITMIYCQLQLLAACDLSLLGPSSPNKCLGGAPQSCICKQVGPFSRWQ